MLSRLPSWLLVRSVCAWVVATGGGCTDEAPAAPDSCTSVIWAQPLRAGETVAVLGSWDDWAQPHAMTRFAGDGAWQIETLQLPEGDYGYLLVEEGAGRIDANNGLTTFRQSDDQEVSLLRVHSCEAPRVVVDASELAGSDGALSLTLSLVPSGGGAAVDAESARAVGFEGTLAVSDVDEDERTAVVTLSPDRPGKQTVELVFDDAAGQTTAGLSVVSWGAPVAATWGDGIMYQVVVDRFRGDGGVALADPPTLGARAGGTLPGVTALLADGYFSALGVSALWLSPVYTNPQEAREGRDDDHLYEGYHGYWALDSRGVDPRIGGEAALHALVAEAHAQGIRVLLDLVPNHLYEDNPRVAEGRAQGWFHEHPFECVCGTDVCPWAETILSCWFTPYLPDLRFEHSDVMAMAVQDALWWHREFNTDGFRIDAVPMMPRAATRRIAHALREATAPRDAAFTIGEVFTGAGSNGTEDLRYYLGPDGLDSAFDFPLMWSLRSVVAHGTGSFAELDAGLAYTDRALAGSGAETQMGRMIGNHDVTRFASEAAGDAAQDGWTMPPPQSLDATVYARQRIALGLVLTLPGLPVLYYGDEVGLAGASDPDNRRVFPGADGLSMLQQDLLASVQRLATLRRCSVALRRGERTTLVAGSQHYAFTRVAADQDAALVVASTADVETELALPTQALLPPGRYVDALGGGALELGASTATVILPPRALAVYVPEASLCAP